MTAHRAVTSTPASSHLPAVPAFADVASPGRVHGLAPRRRLGPMRWSMTPRVGSARLLAAAFAGFSLEDTGGSRLPPTPSTRSRANDAPGFGPRGRSPTVWRPRSSASRSRAPCLPALTCPCLAAGSTRSTGPGRDVARRPIGGCRRASDATSSRIRWTPARCRRVPRRTVQDGRRRRVSRQLDLDNPEVPVIAAADQRCSTMAPFGVATGAGAGPWRPLPTARRCPQGTLVVDPREAEEPLLRHRGRVDVEPQRRRSWTLVPGPAGVELSSLPRGLWRTGSTVRLDQGRPCLRDHERRCNLDAAG